jgi:MFS family permease
VGLRAGRRPARERDTPVGINVAIGLAVVVVAGLVSAAVPQSAGAVRLGLFAVALGLFAATTVDPPAVVLVGVFGFGIFDGFLIDQLGELGWHGAADVVRLLVLLAAAMCGLVVGVVYRGTCRARVWRARQEHVENWARIEWIETRGRDVSAELNKERNEEATRDA